MYPHIYICIYLSNYPSISSPSSLGRLREPCWRPSVPCLYQGKKERSHSTHCPSAFPCLMSGLNLLVLFPWISKLRDAFIKFTLNSAYRARGGNLWKKKQESKKTRKQELDQESDQENKKNRKKKHSFFLDHFLGRVFVFLFSCFLTFLFSFINSPLWDPVSDVVS